MLPLVVRMSGIVDLEAERVLDEVARLFVGQAGHHGCAPRDVLHH
jgi:hypothetical protein